MKYIKKLLFCVLIMLPCALVMTACGDDNSGGGNSDNTYTAAEVNQKLAKLTDSYNYQEMSFSSSITKGHPNVSSGGLLTDESDCEYMTFLQSTSGGEKCFMTSIDHGMPSIYYLSGVSGYIFIDADDKYYYADYNTNPAISARYIKKGELSQRDKEFVVQSIVTKTELDGYDGFYNIEFEKEFSMSQAEITDSFENNAFEVFQYSNTCEYYWDKNFTDKINLQISTFSTGVIVNVYYCKIGDSYYEYRQYAGEIETDKTAQPQQSDSNILNNKYIFKEEYIELDKSYFDYTVSCLSLKNYLKTNALEQNEGAVSWLDSYGFSENEYEKNLIEQIYGISEYQYTFSAEDYSMNNENMIYVSCTRTRLIDDFAFGGLKSFDFSSEDVSIINQTNIIENLLATETITATIGKETITLNVSLQLDKRFNIQNDRLSSINCMDFSFSTNDFSQYTFDAPTSLDNAESVCEEFTTFRFRNTFENKESIKKDRGTVLTFAETVPTGMPAGTTFEGWYYDERYTHPALLTGNSIKVTGADDSFTLYAKYKGLPTITLDLDGGSLVNTPQEYLKIANNNVSLECYKNIVPVRNEYAFEGWYVSTDAEQDVSYINNKQKSGSLTLVAKWAKQYIVKLQTNCDYYVGAYIVKNGDTLDELPKYIDNPGKIFAGWYTDSECTTAVDDSGYYCTETNKTLYAKYVDGVKIDLYTKENSNQDFSEIASITTPKEQPQDFGKFYYQLYDNYGKSKIESGYEFAGYYTDSALTKPYTAYLTEDTSLYCAYRGVGISVVRFEFGRAKSNNNYDKLENYLAQDSYIYAMNLGYIVALDNTPDLFVYNPDGIAKDDIKIGLSSDSDIYLKSYTYTTEVEDITKTYKLEINGFYFDEEFTKEWSNAESFNYKTLDSANEDIPLWYNENGSVRTYDLRIFVDYTIEEIVVE